MNKKGFTLIELLAVIVILAIIALIATPIVLNIISDSKESAQLRSAEMYLDAVEYGIADTIMNNKTIPNGMHTIMENGNICIGTYSNKTCTGDIVDVEVKGEVPKEGSKITIQSGKIDDVSLLYGDSIIVNNKETLEYSICTLVSGSLKTVGSKYSCEVKKGTKYNFYVLSSNEDGTLNLIMDRNINSDGTPSGTTAVNVSDNSSQYNIVDWNDTSNLEIATYGPLTSMQFLHNATKDWTNIEPLNYTYIDKETQNTAYGYIFSSVNGILTITARDGITTSVIGTSDVPLRARMPIYSSDAIITEVTSKTNASYLYDNLPATSSALDGYWTLSAYSSKTVYYVSNKGLIEIVDCNNEDGYSWSCVFRSMGVRPVITVKL